MTEQTILFLKDTVTILKATGTFHAQEEVSRYETLEDFHFNEIKLSRTFILISIIMPLYFLITLLHLLHNITLLLHSSPPHTHPYYTGKIFLTENLY